MLKTENSFTNEGVTFAEMMKRTFLLPFFISFTALFAQVINVRIHDSNVRKAYLYALQGEKTFLIDSIKAVSDSSLAYNANQTKTPIGFYRMSFGDNKFFDFVFDGHNVQLETHWNELMESMRVINSESNKLFYSFLKLNQQYKTKTTLLQLILFRFPKDDPYYIQTFKGLQELQNNYVQFVNVTSQNNRNSFIARYIRSAQLPVVDLSIPQNKEIEYLQSHALDYVNFQDASLIHSDLFTNKTIEYLYYYRNPELSKELLETEFVKAVDTLLNKAKGNQLVYQQVTEYLIDGFKKFGFDNVLDYIVKNYVIKDDLCLDAETEGMIHRRIEQAKLFKIGVSVPNIVLPDSSGKEIDLYKLNGNKILIIFYASWCPHCQDLMPKLKELYNSKQDRNFEVVAVSLDTGRKEWTKFIRSSCADWLNVSDLKSWEGTASNDYFLYATPTMFLLDRDKKLIAIPLTFEEVKSSL